MPVIVPCHRVLRSDGKLGGYVGGLETKATLLSLEAGEADRRRYIVTLSAWLCPTGARV